VDLDEIYVDVKTEYFLFLFLYLFLSSFLSDAE
jgi:hypothetical protein